MKESDIYRQAPSGAVAECAFAWITNTVRGFEDEQTILCQCYTLHGKRIWVRLPEYRCESELTEEQLNTNLQDLKRQVKQDIKDLNQGRP